MPYATHDGVNIYFEVHQGMGHDHPPAYWGRIVELVASHAHSAARMPS